MGRPRPSRPVARLSSLFQAPLPQQARFVLMGLGIAAMLALTLYALLSLARGVELRGFEQHLNDRSTDSVDSVLLAQSFRSDRPNLERIDLQAATYSGLPAPGDDSAG